MSKLSVGPTQTPIQLVQG